MIKVTPKPEPEDFDRKVRQRGLAKINEGVEELPDYWRDFLPQLLEAYGRICSYACIYIMPVTGSKSVDHLAPKSKNRNLAYEWSNYRLACSLMNSRKSDFEDVLDPFEIEDDWFELDPIFWQVHPMTTLSPATRQAVEATIVRLKLNDDDCLRVRGEHYDDYITGAITFNHLKKMNPFVAREVERQGLKRSE